ncbi:MAG: site-specific integrase, partial [Acidimicrobiales bacterium]
MDLDHEVLAVGRTRTPTMRSGVVVGGPKTEAGRRSVAIPPHVAVALAGHLERFVSPERTAWVVVGEHGGPLSAPHLQRAWDKARRSIGRPELHLHDLRHPGLTWVTGATTAELMLRAGHAAPAAAMRYQH